jgi:hypothetical protein
VVQNDRVNGENGVVNVTRCELLTCCSKPAVQDRDRAPALRSAIAARVHVTSSCNDARRKADDMAKGDFTFKAIPIGAKVYGVTGQAEWKGWRKLDARRCRRDGVTLTVAPTSRVTITNGLMARVQRKAAK